MYGTLLPVRGSAVPGAVRGHLLWMRAKDEKGEDRQILQGIEGFFAGEGVPVREGPEDGEEGPEGERREGARLRARVGGVSGSGRRRAGLPVRSDMADLALELHLRKRLPGNPGGPRGRRVLHAGGA